MSDQEIGAESQFFFNGDPCRISGDSATKMLNKGIDPKDVAEMVEKGEYRIEPNRSYEGRLTLFGTMPGGRRVIAPFDYGDDDKIDLVTAFEPDDPECKWFKMDRDEKYERWLRRKSR